MAGLDISSTSKSLTNKTYGADSPNLELRPSIMSLGTLNLPQEMLDSMYVICFLCLLYMISICILLRYTYMYNIMSYFQYSTLSSAGSATSMTSGLSSINAHLTLASGSAVSNTTSNYGSNKKSLVKRALTVFRRGSVPEEACTQSDLDDDKNNVTFSDEVNGKRVSSMF